MSNEKKTVLVRNRSNRNYNGIEPLEIKEVSREYLDSYLQAGFEEYKGEEEVVTDPNEGTPTDLTGKKATETTEESKEELEARKEFLVGAGVTKAKQYQKASRIIEESDALGYKKVEAPATSPDDLSDLDDPAKVIADANGGTSDSDEDEEDEEVVA